MTKLFNRLIIPAVLLVSVASCDNSRSPQVLPNSVEYGQDSSKVTANYKDTTGKVKVIRNYDFHSMPVKDLRPTRGVVVFYTRYQGKYLIVVDDSIVGEADVH